MLPMRVRPNIVANFLPEQGYICVMVTGALSDGYWPAISAGIPAMRRSVLG